MSEYRRLISYMYAYDNGIKNKNVGFAKTECKGGTVRLWINLKGAYSQEENYRVHFFVRRQDAVVGIYMGGLTIKNGMGQFFMAVAEADMAVRFEDICGLYISGEPDCRMFASQWDDLPFKVDNVIGLEEYDKKETVKAAADTGKFEEEPKNPVTAGAEYQETKSKPLVREIKTLAAENNFENSAAVTAEPPVTVEPPVWERPIRMVYVAEKKPDENNTESIDAPVGNAAQNEQAEPRPLHASEEARTMAKAPSPMDMLFDGKEPVLVFSEDEIYDCVDIGLDELPKIKGADSSLINNSFVNHGYFNFHHLLLGKKDGNILVVGVPGVYNRREKMTANMFGFEKFKFSMRSDVCMNHFGYWYKEYQF